MNFAPYQDESPELERALSPPPNNKGRVSSDTPRVRSPAPGHVSSPTPRAASEARPLPPPNHVGNSNFATRFVGSAQERGQSLEAFETSLPMRMDYEAMLAYLLLPPAGGVFLLIFANIRVTTCGSTPGSPVCSSRSYSSYTCSYPGPKFCHGCCLRLIWF
ncbi:hypothetical protein ABEF95_004316 [Exophiala dermatitidis]